MEMSTVKSEWGCNKVSDLQVSIYDGVEFYTTIALDKNLTVSYQIGNIGENIICVETAIINPILWNTILARNERYSYKIIAEDIIHTMEGENLTANVDYGVFSLSEIDWTVSADGTPAIYRIYFKTCPKRSKILC